MIPEDRKRSYDVRAVIRGAVRHRQRCSSCAATSASAWSPRFARVEGRPVGVVANNPNHLAGAIDSDGADKAARFLQLCDAFDIPVVTLVDTPGMMVGPEVEKTALVRHCSRLFVTGANVTVPMRQHRAAQELRARRAGDDGRQHQGAACACVAWPTGEFGGMGLEGAVRLGYRNELAAIDDPVEREADVPDRWSTACTSTARRVNVAVALRDRRRHRPGRHAPLDHRRCSMPRPRRAARTGKKRPNIDTW